MSKLVLSGDTSGSVTLDAPAVSGTTTLTVPTTTDTLVGKTTTDTLTNKTLTSPVIAGTPTGVGVLTSGTSQATTSGTSKDFTDIPSWVKRITVMFSGVSLSSTANYLIQLGSTTVQTTGYVSTTTGASATPAVATSTTGFISFAGGAAFINSGAITLLNVSGNIWVASGVLSQSNLTSPSSGNVTLAGVLDRVRITSTSGTDTFDAGSINIMYE